MNFVTTQAFDMRKHIAVLREKQRTIHHFCEEVSVLLAPIARNQSNVGVTQALYQMLTFDIEQSILICEEQARNTHSLEAQLLNLIEQRDALNAQIEEQSEFINATVKETTGKESPGVVKIMTTQLRAQLQAVESGITAVQAQIEKSASANDG